MTSEQERLKILNSTRKWRDELRKLNDMDEDIMTPQEHYQYGLMMNLDNNMDDLADMQNAQVALAKVQLELSEMVMRFSEAIGLYK